MTGVPQGSILGLLLFPLYIYDIVDSTNSTIRLFADDTSLYIIVENSHDTTRQAIQWLHCLFLHYVSKMMRRINFMIENMICMKQLSLLDVILNMIFVLTLILKLTTLDTSSKFHSLIKGLNS